MKVFFRGYRGKVDEGRAHFERHGRCWLCGGGGDGVKAEYETFFVFLLKKIGPFFSFFFFSFLVAR